MRDPRSTIYANGREKPYGAPGHDSPTARTSLAPFHRAWQQRKREGLTITAVAERLGSDDTQTRRLLGETVTTPRWKTTTAGNPCHVGGKTQEYCSYMVGVRLAVALNVPPREVGI